MTISGTAAGTAGAAAAGRFGFARFFGAGDSVFGFSAGRAGAVAAGGSAPGHPCGAFTACPAALG